MHAFNYAILLGRALGAFVVPNRVPPLDTDAPFACRGVRVLLEFAKECSQVFVFMMFLIELIKSLSHPDDLFNLFICWDDVSDRTY